MGVCVCLHSVSRLLIVRDQSQAESDESGTVKLPAAEVRSVSYSNQTHWRFNSALWIMSK